MRMLAGGFERSFGKDDAPHLSIDGKTARGSRDGSTPSVHLVSAYAPDVKAVLAQLRVDAKTNEHKAALELLGVLAVKDKIITGNAMFTHRAFCAKVIEGGGDYVLPVKENQPTLGKDIAAAFAEPEAGLSPLQAARRSPKSTGIVRSTRGTAGSRSARSRSRRRWPSTWGRTGRNAQVFRLTRERKTGEKVETEAMHGIASLPRELAGARELLELTRGHWGIENGLHGVRDGTLREDASRIRRGSATQVMAIVRNIVIFVFNQRGYRSAAAATRHYVCHPHETLEILSRPI